MIKGKVGWLHREKGYCNMERLMENDKGSLYCEERMVIMDYVCVRRDISMDSVWVPVFYVRIREERW